MGIFNHEVGRRIITGENDLLFFEGSLSRVVSWAHERVLLQILPGKIERSYATCLSMPVWWLCRFKSVVDQFPERTQDCEFQTVFQLATPRP